MKKTEQSSNERAKVITFSFTPRLLTVCATVFALLGCSRDPLSETKHKAESISDSIQPKEETTKSTSRSNQELTVEAPKREVWTYEDEKHNFAIRLPSLKWKQDKSGKRFIVGFWSHFMGSEMLACVTDVKKQSLQQFRDSIPGIKTELDKGEDYLEKPVFEEEKNQEGNHFLFAHMCEKGNEKMQYNYVAVSHVWLADKGITVSLLFEGHAKMISKVFGKMEREEFESAARSICLSPK
jgi:hypothetical protein